MCAITLASSPRRRPPASVERRMEEDVQAVPLVRAGPGEKADHQEHDPGGDERDEEPVEVEQGGLRDEQHLLDAR